ncbi:signal peptidase I [Microbacterium aurantiacum]|uniref:signal peptidase I n=1 Tax=Microbacterium aurantiacum TaxID=162393 RepID=UPI003437BBB4
MGTERIETGDGERTLLTSTRSRAGKGFLFLRDVLVIILIAILVAFLVKTFLVRSFFIPSGSMRQTLIEDDRILVDELTPRFGSYSRGDVVVFRDPGGWLNHSPQQGEPPLVRAVEWALSAVGLAAPDSDEHLIKRVIGISGDHVVCCDDSGRITVNGVAIDEAPYVNQQTGSSAASETSFDVVVPADSLWVLGDNRGNSQDSRFHTDQPGQGFVPVSNVVGRTFLITWPLSRVGLVDSHPEVFERVP